MAAVASSMPLGGQTEGELKASQQAELAELEEQLQQVALGTERLSDSMRQINLSVAQVTPSTTSLNLYLQYLHDL